jgi:hypothetical protein
MNETALGSAMQSSTSTEFEAFLPKPAHALGSHVAFDPLYSLLNRESLILALGCINISFLKSSYKKQAFRGAQISAHLRIVFCLTLSSVTSYPNPVSQSSQREPFD